LRAFGKISNGSALKVKRRSFWKEPVTDALKNRLLRCDGGNRAMPIETRMWEIDGVTLKPTRASQIDQEKLLQGWLEDDISVLDANLLIIGREITTDLGDRLDLLAVGPTGELVIIELKKGCTPREVIAQVLGYTAWAARLTYDEISAITQAYLETSLTEAFRVAFGDELPELINQSQRMIVVAAGLDPYVERSIRYLSEGWSVDINAVFFHCIESSDGRRWLLRSWLEEPSEVEIRSKSRGWTASTIDELRQMSVENQAEEVFDLMLEWALGWNLKPWPAAQKLSFRGVFPDGRRRRVWGVYPQWGTEPGYIVTDISTERIADYFEISEAKIQAVLPQPLEDCNWATPMSAEDFGRLAELLNESWIGR
jgi:hypothetical protein